MSTPGDDGLYSRTAMPRAAYDAQAALLRRSLRRAPHRVADRDARAGTHPVPHRRARGDDMTAETKAAVIVLQTRAAKDAKRYGDALQWIEQHVPDGVGLVARALSPHTEAQHHGLDALERRVVRAFHDGDPAIRSVECRFRGGAFLLLVNGKRVAGGERSKTAFPRR